MSIIDPKGSSFSGSYPEAKLDLLHEPREPHFMKSPRISLHFSRSTGREKLVRRFLVRVEEHEELSEKLPTAQFTTLETLFTMVYLFCSTVAVTAMHVVY